MEKDQLDLKLLNTLESVNKKLDTVVDLLKQNNSNMTTSNTASKELKETVAATNEIFKKVSQGVQDLYAKVQQIEMVAKLAKQFGPMLGGLGGLGGFGGTQAPPKK